MHGTLTFDVGIVSVELDLNGVRLWSRSGWLSGLATAGARRGTWLLVHGQHPGRGVLNDALRVAHKHLCGLLLVGASRAPGALLVRQQELLLVGRVDAHSTRRRRRLRSLLRTRHGNLLANDTLNRTYQNFILKYYM